MVIEPVCSCSVSGGGDKDWTKMTKVSHCDLGETYRQYLLGAINVCCCFYLGDVSQVLDEIRSCGPKVSDATLIL